MAESRRNAPNAAAQEPAQCIPFHHPDPVEADDHFEIEVDPVAPVETSEQPDTRPGGEAPPAASEGGPEAQAAADLTSAADETPEENWSLEKLAWYATRAEERAHRCAHLESAERFRLGKALQFAHKKIPWGQWDAWVDNTFTFTRMTAWRARQLYLRATEKYGERAKEACGNHPIDELYVLLGIKKKNEWLINEEDDDQAPAEDKGQGAQQPTAKKRQTKKRNRGKGKDQDESQRAVRKPSMPPGGGFPNPGDGEPESGDDTNDANGSGEDAEKPQGAFPDDPRRQAEESWKQQYATDGLILMAADCLYDGLNRFDTTMPEEDKAIQLALVTLDQIKDHAERLTQLCEAMREAIR